jgi:hypothetical protein
MFQMKKRYERLRLAQAPDTLQPPIDSEHAETSASAPPERTIETFVGSEPVVLEGPATGIAADGRDAEELDIREPGVIYPPAEHSGPQPSGPSAPAADGDSEPCKGKSDQGNDPRVKASFGLRSSHNEELSVASCGCIVGRKTFIGSESPTNVLVCSHISYLCGT